MKTLAKKWLGAALALAVAFTALAPVAVQAAPEYPSEITCYKTTTGSQDYTSFTVYPETGTTVKSLTIKKSSIKSSNKKVVAPYYLYHYKSAYSSLFKYFEGYEDYRYQSSQDRYAIGLQLKKAGTATISFKVGSTTYKTKVNVKKYVNPLKSVTIKGFNGSKNLAGSLNKKNSAQLTLKSAIKSSVIKVVPKPGYRVTEIEIRNMNTSETIAISNYGEKGVTKGTLNVGKIASNQPLIVDIVTIVEDGVDGVYRYSYSYYYINEQYFVPSTE